MHQLRAGARLPLEDLPGTMAVRRKKIENGKECNREREFERERERERSFQVLLFTYKHFYFK